MVQAAEEDCMRLARMGVEKCLARTVKLHAVEQCMLLCSFVCTVMDLNIS